MNRLSTYAVRRWQGLVAGLSIAVGLLSVEQAWAFKIVSPADGTTVQSGQTVTANVDLGADSGIVKVRYYWYPEQAETLVQQALESVPVPIGTA